MKVIYLAGGCFWGVQKYLNQFKGVTNTVVGYANGHTANPTYQEVKSQSSGHSETVKVEYDENIITLEKLLDYFYRVIDPTSLNKQGEDEGISYRTGIYYVDEEDKEVIHKVTSNVQDKYDKKLVIEILPLDNFYTAEEYHQNYLDKNPTGYCHIPLIFFHMEDEE
ncbi:MAG: peptide-methionine (S)-S-oxide reductase MsrA [Erysipelotrichaceae bacterium]|nr:peptide-methionine (S)-S-oxide reductase MsrA [Erysipelotrichaceae bacterium]